MSADIAALLRDRRFVLLWLAMLVSATGTFALLVTVSAHVLRSSGSGLAAGAVFASQWILPVLLARWVRRACESSHLRGVVIGCEIGGALTSVAVGLLLGTDTLAPALLCFAVRGLFEAATKSARVVFVRLMFEGRLLVAASTTFNLSYYAGVTLGGLAAGALAGVVSLQMLCLIDAATFVVSALCYAMLPGVCVPRSAEPAPGVWRRAWRIASGNERLLASAGYLVIATGCFQGFHNAARTILPIRHLHFSDQVAMQLQGVSGCAIVCGAFAAPLLAGWSRRDGFAAAVFAAACAAMVSTAFVRSPAALFAAYFVFMFLFELTFTVCEAQMIQAARPEDIATLSVACSGAGTALLVVTALATGALADALAFQWVGGLVAAAALAMAFRLQRLRRAAPQTQGPAGRAHPAL